MACDLIQHDLLQTLWLIGRYLYLSGRIKKYDDDSPTRKNIFESLILFGQDNKTYTNSFS